MNFIDFSVIAIYFGVILWIAKWAATTKANAEFSSVDYFLAGKNQGWLVIGASLFACFTSRMKIRSKIFY